MRAALFHNRGAGTSISESALVGALEQAGLRIERHVSEDASRDELTRDVDVVVVAGGDGTVSKLAKRLAGATVPMAVVPMGTVNNVARSLGIGVSPLVAAAGLARARQRSVDLGVVRSGSKSAYFLEGFSVGVFAYVIGEKATPEHKKPRAALGLIADELERYAPPHYRVEIDGRDRSGDYVLIAVMNVRSLGPALCLAPHAQCDDGELDWVQVRPESKEALITHLRRAADEGDLVLPFFEGARTKHVRLRSDGVWAHLDDDPWELRGEIEIGVERGALRVLVPQP